MYVCRLPGGFGGRRVAQSFRRDDYGDGGSRRGQQGVAASHGGASAAAAHVLRRNCRPTGNSNGF